MNKKKYKFICDTIFFLFSAVNVRCEQLKTPFCGLVTLSDHNYLGSVATYRCFSKRLPHPQVRVCIQPGIWTGMEPNCRKYLCESLMKQACSIAFPAIIFLLWLVYEN